MQFGFKDMKFRKMILHDTRVNHSDASINQSKPMGSC